MVQMKHEQMLQEIRLLPDQERVELEASIKYRSEEETKKLLEAAKQRSVSVFMMEHILSQLAELPL